MQARWHLSGGGLALLNILLTAGTVLAQGPPTIVAAGRLPGQTYTLSVWVP
ncbi:MAG: hypothetical protein ABR559_06965 [Gemmatimonadota bacterium]